jgi:hypothetical protein
MEEFYNFDQEVIITVPKEQSKIKKIYKTNITVEDNIVETNSKTIILDPTTMTIESGSSGGPSMTTEPSQGNVDADNNDLQEPTDAEGSASDVTPDSSQSNEPATTPVAEPTPSEPSDNSPTPPSEAPAPSNDSPASSGEGPTS